MQAREWFKAVLAGTAQRVWLCISAISVVTSYVPWFSANITHFIRPWAWAVFAGGFSFANLAAYSEILGRARKAECKLDGVVITLDEARVQEELKPEDYSSDGKIYHFLGINFALTVRNQDTAADSTIELLSCTTDIHEELELNSLGFDRSTDERSRRFRDIRAGCTRRIAGRVVWQLPKLQAFLVQPSVRGKLHLRDTREVEYSVEFELEISKVEHQQGGPTVRRRNWATNP